MPRNLQTEALVKDMRSLTKMIAKFRVAFVVRNSLGNPTWRNTEPVFITKIKKICLLSPTHNPPYNLSSAPSVKLSLTKNPNYNNICGSTRARNHSNAMLENVIKSLPGKPISSFT